MTVKEKVLDPAMQEAKVEGVLNNEALVSYDLAKFLLRDIFGDRTDERFRGVKVALLVQTVGHHVATEEQPARACSQRRRAWPLPRRAAIFVPIAAGSGSAG